MSDFNEARRIEARDKLIEVLGGEIDRLETENWQLKQACGYPIPADKETIHNPFKCGICDARAQSSGIRTLK